MLYALTRPTLVTLAVTYVLLVVVVLIVIGQVGSAAEVVNHRGPVLLAVNGLVLALCVPQVFAIFHAITFAKLWWFPRLDGVWDAELRSNWPRIRRTYDAARRRKPKFDALVDPLDAVEEAEGVIAAKVTIRSSLLIVSVVLQPVGSSRISRTRFVRPQWCRPRLPELSYIYEQEDTGPVAPTDARRHYGAGVVAYDPDRDVISGEYWTQRRDDAGFNTAGTITMTRSV